MHINHSAYYFNNNLVNPVHVWSQGFIADGQNRYCENFKLL